MKKPRAGNYIYKGLEIPINAKIITDKKGRECYLFGIEGNIANLKYIDNSEILNINYNLICKLLK